MKKEIRIGLLALVVLLSSFWLYKFLQGRNLLSSKNIFYIEYTNVNQLGTSDPVLVNGFEIGSVVRLNLKEDLETIIVQVEIKKDIPIPKDVIATIVTTGLTGDKAIIFDFRKPCAQADCLQSGSTITGRTAGFVESMVGIRDLEGSINGLKGGMAGILDTLSMTLSDDNNKNAIGAVFKSISSTTDNLNEVSLLLKRMIQQNQRSIAAITDNLAGTTGVLNDQSAKLSSIIENADKISSDIEKMNLENIGNKLEGTLGNSEKSIKTLNETLAQTSSTLSEMTKTIKGLNDGEGSLGSLLKDDNLYHNLNEASQNLERLLEDMRLNPKRYVHFSLIGRKAK